MKTNVVILIGADAVPHRYVARSLAEIPGSAIVIAGQPQPPMREKIVRSIKRHGLSVLIPRALLKITLRVLGVTTRRENDLVRVLGDPQFPPNVPVFRTNDVNSTDTQNVLRDLSPEVLCVYGTYIVREPTLSTARISLNLHTGISPRYRGADCYFWPLYNAEPNWVGAAVHRCTSEVDGGEIYETAVASLESEDGLGAIFGRSVVAGTEIYKRTVESLLAGRAITPRAQRLSDGTKYFARMRGWKAEIRVAWLIHRGLIRKFVKLERGRSEAVDT